MDISVEIWRRPPRLFGGMTTSLAKPIFSMSDVLIFDDGNFILDSKSVFKYLASRSLLGVGLVLLHAAAQGSSRLRDFLISSAVAYIEQNRSFLL